MQAPNSRIKDLERLYLQKYPGHQQTQTQMAPPSGNNTVSASRMIPPIQFNQYVNTSADGQRVPPSVYSNSVVSGAVTGGFKRKGQSAIRGANTAGGSEFNQTQSTSAYNQRSISNHHDRPLSSLTNIAK